MQSLVPLLVLLLVTILKIAVNVHSSVLLVAPQLVVVSVTTSTNKKLHFVKNS